MIRGRKEGKTYSTWFIGFDHELPVPSHRTPVHDKPVARASSLETLLLPSNQKDTDLSSKHPETLLRTGKPIKEKRDIYKEAFESAKRAEENKFKSKFDRLVTDLNFALAQLSPTGISPAYSTTSYGDVLVTYRARMKELILIFEQRLRLAYESFDIPHPDESTTQRVKQNVSRMVEDLLGETLDLTSDEAVSDLSSLSDESGQDQNSFEDQIAQVIVSKLLENHRKIQPATQPSHKSRLPHNLGNYDIASPDDEVDSSSDIRQGFEELRDFVQQTQNRQLPLPRDIEEKLSPIEEDPVESVHLDNDELVDDFHTRCSSFDRIHNADIVLPDFSDFDSIDFNSHEIDPDLLSMNLASIPEETEEELEDDANEEEEEEDRTWGENWVFKGALSPYDNCGKRRVGHDSEKPLYMMVPNPGDNYVPKVGNKDADELSDLSDTDVKSTDDLSDDENTFYAKTSEELARISRKHSRSSSIQTDSDADADRSSSSAYKKRVDAILQNAGDAGKAGETIKLVEDLIPAENEDPKFVVLPESATVVEGEPLKLSCTVSGTPAIDVFWYHEDKEVVELEDSEDCDIQTDGDRHTITLYNLSKTQAGQYMCIALSETGKCTKYFTITVTKNKQEFKKPEFIKGIQDVEIKEGQSVKFRCKVKGYPQPRVVWFKDGRLLKSSKFCRIEKYGNRDYILTIDHATLDDDAEYTVMAKNVAGETKSAAQVIVDSDNFDEVKALKIDDSSSPMLMSPKNADADVSHVSTLSEKVIKTRNNITEAAENVLDTAEEEKAAKGVRLLTSSALNVLRTAEEIIKSEREESNNFVTSTPRVSDTSRFSDFHNNETDTSSFSNKSLLNNNSNNNNNNIPESTSDSQQRGMSCNVKSVDSDNRTKLNTDSAFANTTPVSISQNNFMNRLIDSSDSVNQFDDSSNSFDMVNNPITNSATKSSVFTELKLDLTNRNNDSVTDCRTDSNNQDSSLDDEIVCNFGPKAVDREKYRRDFESKESKRTKWEVKLDHFSPAAEIVNRKQNVEETEEQIYKTAGKVFSLEDHVKGLESKVKGDNDLSSEEMSDLQNEVAKAVAQVARSENEVNSIEKSVTGLTDSPSPSQNSPRADTSSQLSSRRQSFDSGISSMKEKIEPVRLVGTTGEDEVPESRGEYDADSGIELPSVNRLRAMFSSRKEDELGDGNFKRIHSITARSVSKEQLEKLRGAKNRPAPMSPLHLQQTSASSSPAESPSLTSSSSMQFSFNNSSPKQSTPQTPTSSKVNLRPLSCESSRERDLPSLTRTAGQSDSLTFKDLEPGKEPVLIYPEDNDKNSYKTESPHSFSLSQHTPGSCSKSDKASSRSSTPALSPSPSPCSTPTSTLQRVKKNQTDSESTVAKMKTPKIRSGSISARAAFWEKRITEGSVTDSEIEGEFPDIACEGEKS